MAAQFVARRFQGNADPFFAGSKEVKTCNAELGREQLEKHVALADLVAHRTYVQDFDPPIDTGVDVTGQMFAVAYKPNRLYAVGNLLNLRKGRADSDGVDLGG